MVSREFTQDLHREVPTWVEDGLVTRDQGTLILERYGDVDAATARAPESSGPGALEGVLYGTAGILLGAAALVVLFVGLDLEDAAWSFLVAGLLLGAVGVGLRFVPRMRVSLADAFLVAALVPLGAAGFPEDGGWPAVFGIAAAVALLTWRRDQVFVSVPAVVAFTVSAAAFSGRILEDALALYWVPLQLALLVGVVTVDRTLRDVRDSPAAMLATVAFCVSTIPFFLETLNLEPSQLVEIAVGAVAAFALAAGVLVRHRGVVVGGAVVIAVDAVVFAFDVGGAIVGTGILVALAAVLVWQAEFLKSYFARS